MTDSEFKIRTLQGLDSITPVLGGIVPGTPVRWSPAGAIMRAQDTVPASSRRIVAEWSMSGSNVWGQPRGTDDPGTAGAGAPQNYPENDWRTLASKRANITPGCELMAFALYSPAGLVVQDPGGGFYSEGAWAEVRVGVTWTNGGNAVGPHYKSAQMAGSSTGTYGGGEASSAGENWTNTRVVDIGRMSPPSYTADPTVAVLYSEWSSAAITIDIRGGARVQYVCVYEYPLSHVTEHDNDGLTSVHAMPAGLAALTPGPLDRAPDGATYEEHRFGTRRTMQVAERQSERLGPRIMEWSCHNESTADYTDAEHDPTTTTSTTFVHLIDSAITTYAADTPGWVVAGAYAKLARLCDPILIGRNEIAAVPVRVRVDASRSVANGIVRVQCGPYCWVDVTVTGARAIYTATGHLESQVHADHDGWPLVVWIRATTGGTLSVHNVSVDFGTWVA